MSERSARTTATVDHPHPSEVDVEGERQYVAAVVRDRRHRELRLTVVVNLARIALLVGILALWQGAVAAGWIDEFFWGSPSQVWEAFTEELEDGGLATDVWYTFSASVLGFVIGTVVGTIFGMGLWWSSFAARVFDPYMVAFNAMPKVALAPLITVTLGLGLSAKVLMAVLLVAVIAAIAARDGTRHVDPDQQTLMISLGASRSQVFAKLVLPWTLPWILSAFRINIGLALIGTVVAEFIGGDHGLGIVAVQAAAIYDVAKVWVAVFALGILALLMYWAVDRLERAALKGFVQR